MQKNFFIASLSRLGSELRILTKRSFQNFFCKSYQIAKVNGGEKMVGGTNGGINHVVNYLSVVFHCVELMFESGLRHQKYVNGPQLRSFFMSKIQYLSTFPAILTLSRSTDINVHLPTHVGTDDGISGSIMLVPTGRR